MWFYWDYAMHNCNHNFLSNAILIHDPSIAITWTTVEVRTWMSNHIPLPYMDVIKSPKPKTICINLYKLWHESPSSLLPAYYYMHVRNKYEMDFVSTRMTVTLTRYIWICIISTRKRLSKLVFPLTKEPAWMSLLCVQFTSMCCGRGFITNASTVSRKTLSTTKTNSG